MGGYWRPFQAINGGDTDGNPATGRGPGPDAADPRIRRTPTTLSGHACVTSAHIENVGACSGRRRHSPWSRTTRSSSPRGPTCKALSEIEFDAFFPRIWGWLHSRDAMEDGYRSGTCHPSALAAIN